jgi:hypothetical protein
MIVAMIDRIARVLIACLLIEWTSISNSSNAALRPMFDPCFSQTKIPARFNSGGGTGNVTHEDHTIEVTFRASQLGAS